ncbi:MAG: hypothetical protein AB1629_06020 [Candidatus Omnitrophota bacterium]
MLLNKIIKLNLDKLSNNYGFTLAELMVASLVLVTILVGLLASFVTCLDLNETSRNLTTALDAAQQKVAEIREHSFSDVCAYYNGRSTDSDGNPDDLDDMPAGESRRIVYVYVDSGLNSCTTYNCTCDYKILRIIISVCFRQKSGRVIGEDKNLNGVLDAGEDKNANNQIDSPAQIVTFLTAG